MAIRKRSLCEWALEGAFEASERVEEVRIALVHWPEEEKGFDRSVAALGAVDEYLERMGRSSDDVTIGEFARFVSEQVD